MSGELVNSHFYAPLWEMFTSADIWGDLLHNE